MSIYYVAITNCGKNSILNQEKICMTIYLDRNNALEEVKGAISDVLEGFLCERPNFAAELWARSGRKTYGVAETAGILGVSTSTMWKAVREGSVPSFRIGRRVLISRSTIDAMLNAVHTSEKEEGQS
jgi:excisionase family DNA binding protein